LHSAFSSVLQLFVNLPEIRDRLVAFAAEHGPKDESSVCEEPLCFPRDLAQHVLDARRYAVTGSTLSAHWVLKYQQVWDLIIKPIATIEHIPVSVACLKNDFQVHFKTPGVISAQNRSVVFL
jgi:hypothetical protein